VCIKYVQHKIIMQSVFYLWVESPYGRMALLCVCRAPLPLISQKPLRT